MRRTILAAAFGASLGGYRWRGVGGHGAMRGGGQYMLLHRPGRRHHGHRWSRRGSALSGPDFVRARDGVGGVEGGTGADTVRGGGGDDRFLWGGKLISIPPYTFPDASDDMVFGGQGADYLVGGFGRSGVDELYGGGGNDYLEAQRVADRGYAVTKEVLDCGPGQDTVQFDEGLDVVNANCEERFPFPEGARAPEGTGLQGEPGRLSLSRRRP